MRALGWMLAVLALTGVATTAEALEIEGFDYPATATAAGQPVQLVGAGVRVKWMMNVYVMGVYQRTPKKSAGWLVASDEPKLLWIHMLRGIGGDKMRDAIDDGVTENTGEQERAALRPDLEALKGRFPATIGKGLDIQFVYTPAKGTTLRIGNADKLTVPGKAFMKAIWSIWFGGSPADRDLRKSVLAS